MVCEDSDLHFTFWERALVDDVCRGFGFGIEVFRCIHLASLSGDWHEAVDFGVLVSCVGSVRYWPLLWAFCQPVDVNRRMGVVYVEVYNMLVHLDRLVRPMRLGTEFKVGDTDVLFGLRSGICGVWSIDEDFVAFLKLQAGRSAPGVICIMVICVACDFPSLCSLVKHLAR